VLLSIATSALLPLAPSLATMLGTSLPVAGLIAGAPLIGQGIATLPAGWLSGRFGDRPVMIAAAIAAVGGTSGAALANSSITLGISLLILGFSVALYSISRHAYVTVHANPAIRARSLSLLGATMRVGAVVGPLAGAGLGTAMQSNAAPLAVAAAAAFAGLCVQAIFTPRDAVARHERAGAAEQSVWSSLTAERGLLLRVAGTASIVSAVRAARTILVPLVAVVIGLTGTQTLLVVGVAAAFDLSLFYVGGRLMDRHGALAAGIPSILGLGLGMVALTVVVTPVWFAIVAILLGIANGIGSGFLLTVASDLVPQHRPGPLIGAFRFVSDSGAMLTPFVISGLAAAASVAVVSGAFGVMGVVGALLSARVIRRALAARKQADR